MKSIIKLITTLTLTVALAISASAASAEPLPGTTYKVNEHGYLVKENSAPLSGTTYKADENGYLVRQVDLPPPPPWPHAAANWLILIPPITSGYKVLTSAPLADWQEADSYPSFQACAQAMTTFRSDYITESFVRQGGEINPLLGAVMQQTRHATCIASNDPRLFQNTKQACK
jgi:hypothetical protein